MAEMTSCSPTGPVTQRIRDSLRSMLLEGELRPGEPVRQEALALKLEVSRVPVREALRMLEAEGAIQHTKNLGYSVTQITRDELHQTYFLRRVLETELLRQIKSVAKEDIVLLRRTNVEMACCLAADDVAGGLTLNKKFHFAMFAVVRMEIVVDHIARVWLRSDPYRALILYAPESAERVTSEHDEMVDLLDKAAIGELIEVMDRHRDAGEDRVMRTLDLLDQHRQRAGTLRR